MNTYIYIHVCCINNYKEIFNNIITKIKESGLYDVVGEIRCGILGEYDETIFQDPKIVIRDSSLDLKLYECFTVNLIHEDSKQEDFNVLYMHTKGVTHQDSKPVKDWVNYLCYFNIYQYKMCIDFLKENDTVGVNLQDRPGELCHYAGNFWWSKSNYIQKLDCCINKSYNSSEYWLTENKQGIYVGLWHSKCPHYNEEYPESLYVDKPFTHYFMGCGHNTVSP